MSPEYGVTYVSGRTFGNSITSRREGVMSHYWIRGCGVDFARAPVPVAERHRQRMAPWRVGRRDRVPARRESSTEGQARGTAPPFRRRRAATAGGIRTPAWSPRARGRGDPRDAGDDSPVASGAGGAQMDVPRAPRPFRGTPGTSTRADHCRMSHKHRTMLNYSIIRSITHAPDQTVARPQRLHWLDSISPLPPVPF